jgi:hypothetical protein
VRIYGRYSRLTGLQPSLPSALLAYVKSTSTRRMGRPVGQDEMERVLICPFGWLSQNSAPALAVAH